MRGRVTLLVSVACRTHVTQLGGDPEQAAELMPWESDANAMIVVLCTNANAIVSFSGPAVMGDVPTGTWLARSILGHEHAFLSLGDVHRRLAQAIERQFPLEPRHHRRQGFSLLISGFTWKKQRSTGSRPFQRKLSVAAKYPWRLSVEDAERWIPPGVAAWRSIGAGLIGVQAISISREQGIEAFGPLTPWILGEGAVIAPQQAADLLPAPLTVGNRSIGFTARPLTESLTDSGMQPSSSS